METVDSAGGVQLLESAGVNLTIVESLNDVVASQWKSKKVDGGKDG